MISRLSLFAAVLVLSFTLFPCHAGTTNAPSVESPKKSSITSNEISEIKFKLYEIGRKVDLIDKTQLNYEIENELIKDTYSSNYKTINSVISIVLARQ